MDGPQIELTEEQKDAALYYGRRYSIIVDYWFRGDGKTFIKDHDSESERRCRFCGKSKPATSFRNEAHAIPEFLGNRRIISLNECDECNEYFSSSSEDHLSKWFGPMRTISQIRGKKNKVPVYKTKSESVRLEAGKFIVKSDIQNAIFLDPSANTLELPCETPTEKYVPIKCAQALVKSACSIVPRAELHETQPAIDWIRGRREVKFARFPISLIFVPGPNPYGMGRILILRRRVAEGIPFLWCVLATANYQFQFFIPFCPSDTWQQSRVENNVDAPPFPSPFPGENKSYPIQYQLLNWASDKPISENRRFKMHFDRAECFVPPPGTTINDIDRLIREHEDE